MKKKEQVIEILRNLLDHSLRTEEDIVWLDKYSEQIVQLYQTTNKVCARQLTCSLFVPEDARLDNTPINKLSAEETIDKIGRITVTMGRDYGEGFKEGVEWALDEIKTQQL